MRIGVDVDGVLYEWDRTVRYMLCDVLPDSPYSKDGPLGSPSDGWNSVQNHVSKEHWDWVWTEGVRLGLFRHGHMHKGSIQAVRELAKHGDIIIITSRPKQAVHDTLSWLAYHNLPLSGVHLLTDGEPKSSVQKQCDFYIDDRVENCIDLSVNTKAKEVYLFDQPWNQQINKDWKVTRAFGWPDVVARIKAKL